jgi:hypothetical protein
MVYEEHMKRREFMKKAGLGNVGDLYQAGALELKEN